MATIDVGKLTFTHKGDYSSSTAYVLNDVVYYNGSAYIAKQSTTNNVPTNGTYWSNFAAGSGGIWNSGLSLGTANQVVAVNSGASALEFQTVSSDMVKLAQIDLSANAAQGNSINGYFSSTYENYKLVLNGVHMASGNGGTRVGFYFMRSGSNLTSNNTYTLMRNKVTSSSQGWGEAQEYAWDSSTLMRITQDNDNAAAYTISGTFHLFNVNETNRYAQIVGTLTSQNDGAGDFYSQLFAGRHNTTGAMSGIHLRATADTLDGGSITLYGMK